MIYLEDRILARTKQPSFLRAKIVKLSSEMFFEKGFSKTSSLELSKKLNISTGNLTFYFPTKEHILSVLVQMMIDYQWKEMENATDEGQSSLLAYCLELSTLVAISEEIPEMNDFLVAAYAHPMTIDLIRANDVEKIKKVFGEYTEDWDDERFTEMETIISGIEYATIMKTEHSASVECRLEGALNSIMILMGVPEEIRKAKLKKVLAMDYLTIGRKVYEDFKQYVTETNEHALDEFLKAQKSKFKNNT